LPLTRVPSFKKESLTRSRDSTGGRELTRTDTKAVKRIMKELTTVSLAGATVEAIDGDVFRWEIHMGMEVWRGTPFEADLIAYGEKTGLARELVVEAHFPDTFPAAPPMLRVVRPRFRLLTGGIYGGGGVCMEKLVRQSWHPSFSMSQVLADLRDTVVHQGGRIDVHQNTEYQPAEANAALTRLRRLQSLTTDLPPSSSFSRRVQAFPPVVSARGDMWSLDDSSSIVLSQEGVEELHALGLLSPSQGSTDQGGFQITEEGMCIQLTARNGAQAYCGLIVDEPAPVGGAYVPYAVMQGLGVRDGESLGVKMVTPPPAKMVTVQLSGQGVDTPSTRTAALERLQHMAAVGLGDSFALETDVFITVVQTDPADVVIVTPGTEIHVIASPKPSVTPRSPKVGPPVLELSRELSREEVVELARTLSQTEIVSVIKTPPMRWAQRADRVLLTIELVGCDDASLTFTPEGGMIFSGTAGGSLYKADAALFGGVDVAQSQWDVHGRDIQAMVMKSSPAWWDRLFAVSKAKIKAKCDWDKWKDEDDEEEDNEDFGSFGGERGVDSGVAAAAAAAATTHEASTEGGDVPGGLAEHLMASVAESHPEIVEQAMIAAGGDVEMAVAFVAQFVRHMEEQGQQAQMIAQQKESGEAIDIKVGYMRMDGVSDSLELTTNDPSAMGDSSIGDKKKWLQAVRLEVAQQKGWDPTSLSVWIEGHREETMISGGMSAGLIRSQGSAASGTGMQSIDLRFSRPGGFGAGISVQHSMSPAAIKTPEGKQAFLQQVRNQLAQENGWPSSSITIWIDGDLSSKIQGEDEAAEEEGEESNKLCSNGCGFFGEEAFDGMCQACAQNSPPEEEGREKPKFGVGEGELEFLPTGETVHVVGLKRAPQKGTTLYTIELPDGFQRDAAEEDLRRIGWGEGAGKAAVGWLLKKPKKKAESLVPALAPGPQDLPTPEEENQKPKKKKKKKDSNRCGAEDCRKKLALSAIGCACGLRFCNEHRYPESHECTFDFRGRDRAQLKRDNPDVVASKLGSGAERI